MHKPRVMRFVIWSGAEPSGAVGGSVLVQVCVPVRMQFIGSGEGNLRKESLPA